MDLNTFWFILIAFLFAGYFLLEGFDFGVGILAPIIGKDSSKVPAGILLNQFFVVANLCFVGVSLFIKFS